MRRTFGFHSPEAPIGLAMLDPGGLCPPGHDSLRVKPATPPFHPLPAAQGLSIRCSEYPAPTNMSGGPQESGM